MNVADLARELGVPASTIIEQCQRFGVEASWAGAELGGADVVVLRAELANEEGLLDLTGHGEDATGPAPVVPDEVPVPAEAPPSRPREPAVAAAPLAPSTMATPTVVEPDAALPPTAVGSLPGLAEDLAAEAASAEQPVSSLGSSPRPTYAAVDGVASSATDGQAKVTHGARRDPAVRSGLMALVAAVLALVLAEVLANAWATPALWLVAVGFLLVVAIDGNRARGHAALHPERVVGRGAGLALLGLGLLGLVAVGTATWTATRSQPASSAPAPLGDLRSVEAVRWGYKRVRLVADSDWRSPAKTVGSCWMVDAEKAARLEGRVELGNDQEGCNRTHVAEVVRVFPVDQGEPDAAFPGAAALQRIGAARCRAEIGRLDRAVEGERAGAQLFVEHPTAEGWKAGDHDVACVAATSARDASLLPADD